VRTLATQRVLIRLFIAIDLLDELEIVATAGSANHYLIKGWRFAAN